MPTLDHRREAVAVAFGRQLSDELGDQQPAVREDEDARRARRLHEAGCGDRLAGGGGVSEPVATNGAGILLGRRLLLGLRLLVDLRLGFGLFVLLFVLVLLDTVAVPVCRFFSALGGGDQLGEHPRQRVDLMAAQLGAGGKLRRLLGEHSLEAEHEREAHLPLGGRLLAALLDLGQGLVESPAPRRLGRKRVGRFLAVVEERLSGPFLGAFGCGDEIVGRRERYGSLLGGLLHVCGVPRLPRCLQRKGALGIP